MKKTMLYKDYKNNWAGFECVKTVKDSYDAERKTIDVIIPDVFAEIADLIPAGVLAEFGAQMSEENGGQIFRLCDLVHIIYLDLRNCEDGDMAGAPDWQMAAYQAVKKSM